MSENDLLETEELMRELGKTIDYTIGHRGFVLLVFNFNEPCVANYVSNAKREIVIKTLRETADRFERNETIPAIKHKTIQ